MTLHVNIFLKVPFGSKFEWVFPHRGVTGHGPDVDMDYRALWNVVATNFDIGISLVWKHEWCWRKSFSVITRSTPITRSNSSWAFCWTLGFLITSAMAHSADIAVVSIPALILTQRRPITVSSLRSYLSFKVSKEATKCCLEESSLVWPARVCSSIIILVSLSLLAPCLANASSSIGNIQRTQSMCSAMFRDAPNLIPFPTIALNSFPCSSISPSEFINRFPNTSLVMLLKATAPRKSLTGKLFSWFSVNK
ncbi:hypothetical protein G4B88_010933 [Cannabis sativa]|uniref:Uncharacterized protein n=1 Tax=Cannabis sativa TaxID=3483 RepID=A0A7J6HLD4_CANSA|nr:hypothetical protein G4B88_010933 [Cannabis sativa]